MKRSQILLSFLLSAIFISQSFAQTNLTTFLTSRDLLHNDSTSKINLRNNRSSVVNVYGLYVRQFALVNPGENCQNPFVIYATSQNTTAGALVMPITIRSGQSAAVGSNYLYNMIYQAIYFERIIIPSNPPGCALPGCTWGDDVSTFNWCIYLGALSPVITTAGYTANVPPSTDLASNPGNYNYDLISDYVYLGPISCNDLTLTCSVVDQQTQSFS